jgi:hypothetical protein
LPARGETGLTAETVPSFANVIFNFREVPLAIPHAPSLGPRAETEAFAAARSNELLRARGCVTALTGALDAATTGVAVLSEGGTADDAGALDAELDADTTDTAAFTDD